MKSTLCHDDPDYDGPLKPTLRLFLSVDIVSSTAFKQSNQRAFKDETSIKLEGGEPWFSPIAQFYREIERLFAREWNLYISSLAARIDWPAGPAPELWKSAGDELLYIKVLTDHREAVACIICWKKTIEEYRSKLKKTYPALDLKCTAWVAGFPITNTEVVFSKNVETSSIEDDDDPVYVNMALLHQYHQDPDNPNLSKDFIGPTVDTGFRLCSLSCPRKFVISIDLALLIVHALRAKPANTDEINLVLHYDGRVQLKGVLGGKNYPVFWIDMAVDSSLEKLEDKLLQVQSRNTDEVKDFCEEFFRSHSSNIIIPYIIGNKEAYFGVMPEFHFKKISALREYWKGETERRKQEKLSVSAADDGNNIETETVDKLIESIKEKISKNIHRREAPSQVE